MILKVFSFKLETTYSLLELKSHCTVRKKKNGQNVRKERDCVREVRKQLSLCTKEGRVVTLTSPGAP